MCRTGWQKTAMEDPKQHKPEASVTLKSAPVRCWVLQQLLGQLHIPSARGGGRFVTSPAWDLVTAGASQPRGTCKAEGFSSCASYSAAGACQAGTSPCSAETPQQLGGHGRALSVSTQTDHQWHSYRDKMDGRCPAEPSGPHLQRYQLGSELWSLTGQAHGSFPRACGPAVPREVVPSSAPSWHCDWVQQ